MEAKPPEPGSGELFDLQLEDLMTMTVTSVSKTEQPLFSSPNAVFVVTKEDIRRAGSSSIPELLRMVPGLNVARIDAYRWAISSRGFNSRYAATLLVLVDGVSVYSNAFSGVFWEALDLPLEDIDRIEVIRGSGAAVWGAGAVNGVVNIITRPAAESPGGRVGTTWGSYDRGGLTGSYSGALREGLHYRVFARSMDRRDQADPAEPEGDANWTSRRAGLRVDWAPSQRDAAVFQGSMHEFKFDDWLTTTSSLWPPVRRQVLDRSVFRGGNLLARWTHAGEKGEELTLQADYDYSLRHEGSDHSVHTADFELHHRFAIGNAHQLIWGIGYRFYSDELAPYDIVTWNPAKERSHLITSFVQEEWQLRHNVHIIAGTKLDWSTFSSLEVEPNVRLLWQPRPSSALWASVSRAVRRPDRGERAIRVNLASFYGPDGTPTLLSLLGDPDFKSEKFVSYEVGYRVKTSRTMQLDVTAFHTRYTDLESRESGVPFFESQGIPHLTIPIRFGNQLYGHGRGVEVASSWQASERWQLSLAYSHLDLDVHSRSSDTEGPKEVESRAPTHKLFVRSHLRLPHHLELDLAGQYTTTTFDGAVPARLQLDAKLGYHVTPGLELSLGATDLLDPRHREFAHRDGVIATDVRRRIFARVDWKF